MLPCLCCPFPGGFYSEIHLSLLLGGCFLLTYDSSFLDHLPPKPLIRESRVGRVLGIVKKDFPPFLFLLLFLTALLSDRNSVCPDLRLIL